MQPRYIAAGRKGEPPGEVAVADCVRVENEPRY